MIKSKWIFLLPLLGIIACQSDKSKKITADDVADVEAPIIFFHQKVADAENRSAAIASYPNMSTILFKHIAGIPMNDSVEFRAGVDTFLDDEVTRNIYNLIDSVYSDWSEIGADWTKSMKLYKYYFPEQTVPSLYTIQSNLGIANFMFEDGERNDAVGASLDFFLGSAYPYIELAQENPVFSAYNSRTFNPDHLVTKSLTAVLDDLVPEALQPNFLHYMIREGKKLYLLKQISPHIADTAIFEFTPEQLAWCEGNEFEIWNFFMEKELIYETTMAEVMKYMQAAPSSSGMPKESPGRTAPYIGYKIIESYMSRNAGTDYAFLLGIHDAQKILDEARYKPRTR